MNAINVAKPSARRQTLKNIRKFILKKNSTDVMNVGKPLARAHILQNTRKFIVERRQIYILSVGKPLDKTLLLFNMKSFTLERNPLNALGTWLVWRPSPGKQKEDPENCQLQDFPGGAVVKNPPANAGDTGSIPGPGRSHMPRSS